MIPTTCFLAVLLGFGLSVPSALAQSSDVVHLVTGRQTRGRIDAISATEITLDVRGTSQVIPVNEVRQITFSQEPSTLRRARDMIRNGQLQDALLTLNQIDRDSIRRDEVRVDVQFYSAYCQAKMALTRGADLTAVSVAMFNFIKQNSSSYHYFTAVETLGDLAMALEKYAGAVKFYSRLSQAPWPSLQMRGALLEARALRGQGNFDQALTKYDEVIAAKLSTAAADRQRDLARIGRAACQAELGQADKGIQSIEQVIDKGDAQDTELFAEAYNALGACYRKMNKPQDALLAYLHVDLLFYQDADAHAEALYYLSDLWAKVKKPQRAVAARSLLKSRYPASRWAKR